MKKILLTAVLLLSLSLSVCLCACEHKHDTGNWIDEVPATCQSDGVMGHYHCDECGKDIDRNGKEIEDLILKKTDHQFSYTSVGGERHVKECVFGCGLKGEEEDCSFVTSSVIKQATCTEAGEELRVCAFCKAEKKVTVAGAHVFDLEKTATPATCSKAGNTEFRHCSVCDENISPDGKILKDNEWVIPATGEHSFIEGVVTKEPTCKEKGEKTLTCIHCGEEKTEELPVTDHFPVKVPESLPTCYEEGLSSGEVCAYCETVIKAQEVLPKLEHEFTEWETVVEPDDEFGGLKVRTCTICLTSENEEVTPSEHTWGEWKYEENDMNSRTCTDCGAKETISCLYSAGVVIAPTCTEGGHTESVCQLCKNKVITDETKPLEHDFGAWKADKIVNEEDVHVHSHTRVCKHCGLTETENCHLEKAEVIAPTCEMGGYTINRCKECASEHEDTLTAATGHSYGAYEHVEEHQHSRTCTKCSKVETNPCYYTTETIPATCKEEGKTRYTCDTCGHTYDANIVPVLEHAWTAWTFDKDSEPRTHSRTCTLCNEKETQDCVMVKEGEAPTCTAQGSLKEFCKECLTGESKDNENTSLGHEWEDWKQDTEHPDKHVHVCKRCGATESVEHTYSEEVTTQANCINPTMITKTCSTCNYKFETTKDEALGHEWGEWTVTKDMHSRTCSKCQTKEETPHTFTETNFCDDCNFDCLTYAAVGSHFVLKSDENLPNNVEKVIIPATHTENGNTHSVTEIDRYAFFRKTTIKEVVLPESVHTIDDSAFNYCTSLERIVFEEPRLFEENEAEAKGLHVINLCAFEGCAKLTSFPLPATVETIGYRCFSGCKALKEMTLGENVKSIGSGAFEGTALIADESKWKENVFILGNHLIDTKASEETSYTIPENIISIGRNAFTDWTALTELTVPNSVI